MIPLEQQLQPGEQHGDSASLEEKTSAHHCQHQDMGQQQPGLALEEGLDALTQDILPAGHTDGLQHP